jgi:hypothetical protein
MAIINYTDQIKYAGKGYLDAKMMPVKTFEDLKNIPSTQRFEGLTVLVLNDGKPQDYWLVGGISNSCWKPKTAANFDSLRLTLEDGFLKLLNAEIQLGESIDLNNFFPENSDGIHIVSVDYATTDANGETGIFMCFTYSDNTKKYLNMAQFLTATYEAGNGIVIDGNVISIDDAISGTIKSLGDEVAELKGNVGQIATEVEQKANADFLNEKLVEITDKFTKVNEALADKADISDIDEIDATLTGLSTDIQNEASARETADKTLQENIDKVDTEVKEIGKTVEGHKATISQNSAALAELKTRVDGITSNVEGATPDGRTIGITDDESKALCVKILEKEGNMLSVDTHNGATGLYAGFSYFCEDDEIKE